MTLPKFDPWEALHANPANLLNDPHPISGLADLAGGRDPNPKVPNAELRADTLAQAVHPPAHVLRQETVPIDISTRRVPVTVGHEGGRVVSIAMPPETDPVRSGAAHIVNDWLAEGDGLEAMALRNIALTELVAGLICWQLNLTP